MTNLNPIRARLCALFLIATLIASGVTVALAQHQGHNMQDMPGMGAPSSPTTTPPPSHGKTETEHTPGMQMPAATSTPAPSATPPSQHTHNMPGMQMPANPSSPTPQASPSP